MGKVLDLMARRGKPERKESASKKREIRDEEKKRTR